MRMPLSRGYHNWTYRLLTGRAACNSSILAQLSALGISAVILGGAGNGQPALAAEPLPAATALGDDSNNSGPIVTIIQPSYSSLLKGREQIVIGVQTRLYPAKSVEMYVDDKLATPGAVPLDAVPQAAFDWDTAKFADGPHLLRVTVTDTQGFIGQAEVRIYVNNGNKRDTVPPAMDWLNLRSGEWLSGLKNIELQAADNFGVKYIFVFLNPAETPKRRPALRSWLLNRPPYVIPLDTMKVADGLYALDAIALDPLENEGFAPTLFIGISNHSINPTTFQDWKTRLDALVEPIPAPSPVANLDPPPAPQATAVPLPAPDPTAAPVADIGDPGSRIAGADVALPAAPSDPLPELSTAQRPYTGITVPALQGGTQAARTESAQTRADRVGLNTLTPSAAPRRLPNMAKTPPVPVKIPGSTKVPSPVKVPSLAKTPTTVIAGNVAPRPQDVVGAPELSTAGKPVGAFTGAFSSSLVPSRDRGDGLAGTVRPTTPVLAGRAPQNLNDEAPTHLSGAPLLSTATQDVNTFTGAFSAPRRPAAQNGQPAAKPLRPSSPRNAMAPSMRPRGRSGNAAITVSSLPRTSLTALYVAQRNEALLAVAQRCKLPVAALAAANKLSPTAQLKKGAQIRLPQTLAVSYHGQPVEADVASILVGSTAMTPFRFLFEQQGGTLVWDGARQRVLARNDKHEVVLTIGSRTAIVNKKETMMNLAAFLMSGRTMVPVRFFEKALHAQVEWEPSTGRLFVAMTG